MIKIGIIVTFSRCVTGQVILHDEEMHFSLNFSFNSLIVLMFSQLMIIMFNFSIFSFIAVILNLISAEEWSLLAPELLVFAIFNSFKEFITANEVIKHMWCFRSTKGSICSIITMFEVCQQNF